MAHTSCSVGWQQTEQGRIRSLTARRASDSASTSPRGAASRWCVRRPAVLGPTPGSLPSSCASRAITPCDVLLLLLSTAVILPLVGRVSNPSGSAADLARSPGPSGQAGRGRVGNPPYDT